MTGVVTSVWVVGGAEERGWQAEQGLERRPKRAFGGGIRRIL